MTNRPENPIDSLRTHRAPSNLLDRAVSRAASSPTGGGPWQAAARIAAVFALGLGLGTLVTWPTAPPETAPEVETVVRLVIRAEGAQSVGVAGSWNGWQPELSPMTPVGDGLFRAELTLEPGRHEYMFVVDGVEWRTDVAASRFREDGFGNRNAVIEI